MTTPIKAPSSYDMQNEQAYRDLMQRADDQNVKKGYDIVLRTARSSSRNPRIVIYSPDGSAFALSVANDGTLSTVAL